MKKLVCIKDTDALNMAAARHINEYVKNKPSCIMGLPTGTTPEGTYHMMCRLAQRGEADFSRVTTFNLDEYCGIDIADKNSYHSFMYEMLFRDGGFDMAKTHFPDTLASDETAAMAAYDDMLAAHGGIDFQLMGIGRNGHIGFNEPAENFSVKTHKVYLTEETRQINSRLFDDPRDVPRAAITMGIGGIMQAEEVLLLCFGEEKADILFEACMGKVTPQVPGSILQFHRNCIVVGDEPAMRRFFEAGIPMADTI